MSLRVVVYAEGVGELAKEWGPSPAPGVALAVERLGPAHILASRSIERCHRVPRQAIVFEQGLRTASAREPRGSDLHRDRTLRRLLSWPDHELRPDLALVFLDEDDERDRASRLAKAVAELHASRAATVIAVARKEFEAWLVTDHACLARLLGRSIEDPGDLERWKPGEAKSHLTELLEGGRATEPERFEVRRSICRECDLDLLARRSASFGRFLKDLAALELP